MTTGAGGRRRLDWRHNSFGVEPCRARGNGVGPAVRQHGDQRGSREEVDARHDHGLGVARGVHVEDHQRQHHDVGHRVAAEPFHGRDRAAAELRRQVGRGDERQQVEQLEEREEDRHGEDHRTQEVFAALVQRPDDGRDRVLVGPHVDGGEADHRQDDAEGEEHRRHDDEEREQEVAHRRQAFGHLRLEAHAAGGGKIRLQPGIGEDHQHDGGGEEVDRRQAGRVVHALALEEEDRQRQHQHVVHRPFADPLDGPEAL